MTIKIDYYEKMAYVYDACHPDGREYDMKGIKKKLQTQAKTDGYYGLEFWHYNHDAWHPATEVAGFFKFEILDMYGRL